MRGVGVTQVDSQLPDVDKGVLVGDGGVDGEELNQTVLHEAYARLGTWKGELAVADKGHVEFLTRQGGQGREEGREEGRGWEE